jgi:1-acyl-sn-glycerol-3-phosphate acyltransferase
MIAALIAGFARLVTGATARWLVEPRSERQRVYFANHASHFDFVTIWAALPPPQRAHAARRGSRLLDGGPHLALPRRARVPGAADRPQRR